MKRASLRGKLGQGLGRLTSFFRRRWGGRRPAPVVVGRKGRQPTPAYRPLLEGLEDRLPPGDVTGFAWLLHGAAEPSAPAVVADQAAAAAPSRPTVAEPWAARSEREQPPARPAADEPAPDLLFQAADRLADPEWTDALFGDPCADPVHASGKFLPYAAAAGWISSNGFFGNAAPAGVAGERGQAAPEQPAKPAFSGGDQAALLQAARLLFQAAPARNDAPPPAAPAAPQNLPPAAVPPSAPTGNFVVQLQAGMEGRFGELLPLIQSYGATAWANAIPGLYEVEGPGDLTKLAAALSSRPFVSYVETPKPVHAATTNPNDPRFTDGTLWNLNGTNGIRAPQAWDQTTGGSNLVVAVVDSGVDYRHPDLYLNVWINQGEIPAARRANLTDVDEDGLITFWDLNDARNQGLGKITDLNGNGVIDAGDLLQTYRADGTGGWANGVSDDGDTYVDDLCGWNFVSNNNNPLDDFGHGTHVTGTLGAVGNNGTGVVGVAWQVQLMPLKILDSAGSGTDLRGANAIRYAADHGARVSNNSWGGGGSTTLATAIQYARDRSFGPGRGQGHVVVAAAGNNGRDNDVIPFNPSSYPYANIIAVTATDINGARWSSANYGATTVDIAAPGVSVYSTLLGGSYGYYTGTSMAAPHVTGTVALVLALHPDWSYTQVIDRVLGSASPRPGLQGLMTTGGLLNAAAAVANSSPTLAPIDDREVPAGQQEVVVPLSATDPDGDALTFSATAESLAYVLDQQLDLSFAGDLYENYGGLGERWVVDAAGQWYFILPNGEFYRSDDGSVAAGKLVGTPGASYWSDPSLLYDAQPGQPYASLSVSGTTLTITRDSDFVSSVVVTVTVSDGLLADSRTFTVTVTS